MVPTQYDHLLRTLSMVCSGKRFTTASPQYPLFGRQEPPMSLLTVDRAAARLSTGTRFIRRLIAERRIPYVKLGAHVRIDDADLDAFIDAGRVDPTARQLPLGYPQGAAATVRPRAEQRRV
jgi:excisionase family DNA binding protein